MNLPIRWSKIRIKKIANKRAFEKAQKAAKNHPQGDIRLPFTESNFEWVLLYDHAMVGQIAPTIMKFMRRRDLKFLAGHTFPHPALTQPKPQPQEVDYNPATSPSPSVSPVWLFDNTEENWDRVTKLQGNAARAKMELERRNFVWASVFAVSGAVAGGLLGGQLIEVLVG